MLAGKAQLQCARAGVSQPHDGGSEGLVTGAVKGDLRVYLAKELRLACRECRPGRAVAEPRAVCWQQCWGCRGERSSVAVHALQAVLCSPEQACRGHKTFISQTQSSS